MGRDRGRGKGGGRGGSGGRGSGKKMYIDNVEELQKREGHQDDDDDDDEEGGEEGGEKAEGQKGETVFGFERKAATGATVAEADEAMAALNVSNPNRTAEAGMNRKEREALAAAKAREDYQRRHMAGETEQAKKELALLAVVRARREAAAKKRESEGRPPGWTEAGVESSSDDDSDEEEDKPKAPKNEIPASIAKKKAALEAEEAIVAADGGPAKLNSMDIKKMNGDALKDHLKERGLSLQGQKKDLMKRLIDYEAARP